MTSNSSFNAPTITVVVPTYNRLRFLLEAIQSIFSQTRPPQEIIVIDDGSTDDTESAIAHFGQSVRYIKQPNAGPAAARNNGMLHATGNFIAFLDSDDLWAPNRLEKQLEVLKLHPSSDLLFGLESKFTLSGDENGCAIQNRQVMTALFREGPVILDPLKLLLLENFIPTSSVLFRRECLKEVGNIDRFLRQAEDYDFWLRFALAGFRFSFINAVLCRRRIHGENLVLDWEARTISTANVLERYRHRVGHHEATVATRVASMHYDLGSRYLAQRNGERAIFHLRKASPIGFAQIPRVVKLTTALILHRRSQARNIEHE